MSFLLDTDICSAYLRGDRTVFNRFLQHTGGLHVSAVSLAELYSWAHRAAAPPRRLESLQSMLDDVKVLDVTADVARTFGRMRAALLDQGRPLPTPDLIIAATALLHDLTLVTHNIQHFRPVPGLRVQDWLSP